MKLIQIKYEIDFSFILFRKCLFQMNKNVINDILLFNCQKICV